MDLIKWADNEIKLAMEKEGFNNPKDCMDVYIKECYDRALKAFKSIYDDNHSGMSIKITQNILNNLIDVKPLTAIEDSDFVRDPDMPYNDPVYLEERGMVDEIQCPRMTSLFKSIYKDGTVKYHDVDRVIFHDCAYDDIPVHMSIISRLIDSMFPVKMPYSAEVYNVYGECILLDENGNRVDDKKQYNKIIAHYVICPDGTRVELNKEWDVDSDDD